MNDQNNETMKNTLTDEEAKAVCGGTSSKTPGISCPRCGKFIPTTITELLTQGHLRCPYCLMKLKIDRENPDAPESHKDGK